MDIDGRLDQEGGNTERPMHSFPAMLSSVGAVTEGVDGCIFTASFHHKRLTNQKQSAKCAPQKRFADNEHHRNRARQELLTLRTEI